MTKRSSSKARPSNEGPNREAGWFGFTPISPKDKAKAVGAVFRDVASSYDIMNDVMSLGVHRLWKRRFVNGLPLKPGAKMLDLAGGTGDIAFLAKTRAPRADVTVADINPAMIEVGRKRALDRGFTDADLRWMVANAEDLPFASRSFDVVTIAFGLRNVTRIDKALAEMARVLRPGGHFFCLEFSAVALPGLDKLYDFYSFEALPWFGEKIAKNRDAYRYLAESIRQFPSQENFKARIEDAGFRGVSYSNLSGGIAAIHTGRRV